MTGRTPSSGAYGRLQPERVLETIVTLEQRIVERFPQSGLLGVCRELQSQARQAEQLVQRLGRPVWPLRIGVGLGAIGLVAMAGWIVRSALQTSTAIGAFGELLQATEAGFNVIIMLALAMMSMVTLEARLKRRSALRSLHRLRSIVHIIDMHQLTKDPEFVLFGATTTLSSPPRTLTRFLLVRYLDYCAELLALASKVAALHVQYLEDDVVLEAVSDIETLTGSLAGRIWQKIMILDAPAAATLPPGKTDQPGREAGPGAAT